MTTKKRKSLVGWTEKQAGKDFFILFLKKPDMSYDFKQVRITIEEIK